MRDNLAGDKIKYWSESNIARREGTSIRRQTTSGNTIDKILSGERELVARDAKI